MLQWRHAAPAKCAWLAFATAGIAAWMGAAVMPNPNRPGSDVASHPLRLLAPLLLPTLVGTEQLLAQPDRGRGDLDQLVVGDIGERLLQRHLDRRDQPHGLVLGMGADIGELLALEHVDLEVVAARVLAHDHAAIDLPSRVDHHRPAVLEIPQRVGHGLALVVGDQHAVAAAHDLAPIGTIAVEQPVHDRGAARVGEQLAVIADEAARRRQEHEPHAGRISVISALRSESFCTTMPACASSTSMTTSSIGSRSSPSAARSSSTFGRDTDSSKPSRRMVSIRMPSCNSPRPATSMASFSVDSLILSATLPSASRRSRSRITRLCTLSPSVPASGESLMRKVIAKVGGSMGCAGSGSVTSGAQIVCDTVASGSPAIATMSPADASSTPVRSRPRKASTLVTRLCSISCPLRSSTLTPWLGLTAPELMRPVTMRPR